MLQPFTNSAADLEQAIHKTSAGGSTSLYNAVYIALGILAELVTAYYGKPLPGKIARARLLGLAGKYGWTLWGAIQHAASPLDFDFWSWAMERFEGAAEGFSAGDFTRLLEDVQRDD